MTPSLVKFFSCPQLLALYFLEQLGTFVQMGSFYILFFYEGVLCVPYVTKKVLFCKIFTNRKKKICAFNISLLVKCYSNVRGSDGNLWIKQRGEVSMGSMGTEEGHLIGLPYLGSISAPL